MKILEGNTYVCIKECKDFKGRTIPIGTICHASKGNLLYGFTGELIYSQVEPMDDYVEYFFPYEESPYNKEQKALRNQAAISAMQSLIINTDLLYTICKRNNLSTCDGDFVAKIAVKYANALVEELKQADK